MSYYDPQIITLRLSQTFLRTLKDEAEWAHLADGIHTTIPDSLLQLADFVLAELEPGDSNAPETWQIPSRHFGEHPPGNGGKKAPTPGDCDRDESGWQV